MIDWLLLKKRNVELVGEQRVPDMTGQVGMAVDRRIFPGPAALVGRDVAVVHAEYKRRIVIDEERGDVIVVDEEQYIGPPLG